MNFFKKMAAGLLLALSLTILLFVWPNAEGAVMPQVKTFQDFSKIIATAGTELQIDSTVLVVDTITVQADFNNATDIVVGVNTQVAISAVIGSTRGTRLTSGQSYTFSNVDISTIYVDVLTSGDAVHGTYTY